MEKERKLSITEKCLAVIRKINSNEKHAPAQAKPQRVLALVPGKNNDMPWLVDDAKTLSSINTSAFESSSDEESVY